MISMAKTRMLLHDHYDNYDSMMPGTRIWGSCEANWDEDPGCAWAAWDVFILGVVWAISGDLPPEMQRLGTTEPTARPPCCLATGTPFWQNQVNYTAKIICARLASACDRIICRGGRRKQQQSSQGSQHLFSAWWMEMDNQNQPVAVHFYCICVPSCPLWTGRSILRVYQWILSGSSPISPSVGWSDVQPRIAWP